MKTLNKDRLKNGGKLTQEEEEEVLKQKQKKQRMAKLKFSKERYYTSADERQSAQDLQNQEPEEIKVVTKRQRFEKLRKEYNLKNFEDLLMEENEQLNINWLPLHYFDDYTMETIFIDDTINFEEVFTDELGERIQVDAEVLWRLSDQHEFKWFHAEIIGYNEKIQKFRCQLDNSSVKLIPRIYVCLDIEDPVNFAKRLMSAFQRRLYADSLIRYSKYTKAMPVEHLSDLSEQTKRNIELLVRNKRFENAEITSLMMEISQQYSHTMNGIIFDKYLEEATSDLVPHSLVLPPKNVNNQVKYYGLLPTNQGPEIYMWVYTEVFKVPAKEFTDIYKEFCINSFLITPQVINILQQAKEECNEILKYEFFNIGEPTQAYKIEEFQSEQESASYATCIKLKNLWQPKIEKIIQSNFQGEDKTWLNLKISDMNAYKGSKLKRFLTLIEKLMQDNILYLCQKSFQNYLQFVTAFVPTKVEIQKTYDVANTYKNGGYVRSTIPDSFYSIKAVKPLFQLELLKNTDQEIFHYSQTPEQVVQIIQNIFDKLLDDLNKIPSIEGSLLHDLFRKTQYSYTENYLKAPKRNKHENEEYQSKSEIEFDENQWVNEIFKKLTEEVQQSIQPLQEYLTMFDPYRIILKENPDEYVKQFDNEEKPVDIMVIREDILKKFKLEQQLREEMPESIQVSLFLIKSKDTVNFLANKYQKMAQGLTELIAKRARKETANLLQEVTRIKDKVKEQPANIEKLVELEEYMQGIPMELEKIDKQIHKSMDNYNIMEEFLYKFTEDDIKKKWLVFGGPKDVYKIIEDQQQFLENQKVKFKEKMENDQEEFKADIDDIDRNIAGFNQHTNKKDYQSVASHAENINDKLKEFNERSRKFNNQENLFERPITDYSKVQQMVKDFTPYSNLWITSRNWFQFNQNWLYGKFQTLDADGCEKFVEDAVRIFNQTTRFFKDKNLTLVHKISAEVKAEIDEFRPKVPLMVALRKEGMRDRHWKQISDIVGFEVYPDEDYTFTKILDMGLLKYVNQCQEIGERAYKEYVIETELKSMKAMWNEINLILKEYIKGSTKTFIITGYDDINTILDEHMLKTQAMQFSPFKKPFEDEITDWNDTLKLMSEIMEAWCKYQVNWMYLQPIFDSPDISKQLPGEYKKFKTVDNNWKSTMAMANNIKNVVKVCLAEGLLQKLKDGNHNLDIIQKELNNYLERKRERFSRFFFLSDDELLEILSRTKDPSSVQPFLKKVFENIYLLDIQPDKKFLAMFSGENERVEFVKIIDPNTKNVEDWMGEVEDQMKISVRHILKSAIFDYPKLGVPNPKKTRVEWVKSHPGQAVLNGSQVHWTEECETALSQNKVQEYWNNTLQSQLNDLVEAVRLKLTVQQKLTLNALIVIDVHAKDVVENLFKGNIVDPMSFEWISQLRYYWRVIEDMSKEPQCYVKMVQTIFPYGYEYLGNSLRLVITALTDKCYMTLMTALKLNLGGAPAGPAGTGKTESTKDLAKALSIQCVVFNCSDTMDYIMVAKFFKGLASCGAWCCFDEFNRINIEVLSVIAQQLQILFDAKRDKQDRIENFEGSDIRMKDTFCVFITMNPGYAGRTELPDNLKALFRGVAMMVPDYALIGEIMLYSFGFKQGRELAKKMVVTFKLSSEQLSSQDHYDYGMRAVRSVINAAGLLKSQEPDMQEDLLLLRALRDVNVPKFLKDDIPLFENIIMDLFPGVVRPPIDYGSLFASITENCKKQNVQGVESFINKVIQLYDTTQVRHGLMVVGPTGGGKTTNLNVLQGALSDLDNQGYYKVQTWIMNPKSITMTQLYGGYNEATREWSDGVLALTVRNASRDISGVRHWVIFDGPVDAIWIENMNTVLDDNKKLCLNSGEILTLTKYMTMMFEVEDLTVASPATVSRCGMVYMEPQSMGLQPLVTSWIDSIPQNCQNKSKTIKDKLQKLFDIFLEPSIDYLRQNLKETVVTIDNNLCQSLCRIMNCYLKNYNDTELKRISDDDIKSLEDQIESLFLYSTIWSLCCTVDYAGRNSFDKFIREEILAKNEIKYPLPAEKRIYDYIWDMPQKKWILWSESYKNFEIDPKLQYNEIMIPTNDSTRNSYNMKLLLGNLSNVMFPGPTGTGKSLNAYNLLQNQMGEAFQYTPLTFSAQTGANQTQDTIDSKMDKRRRGIFGPPVGKKLVIFVDDLNMPKKEYYGAQPPLELLRQYLDHKGWYDRKDYTFRRIEDVVLLAAMGPPGGGRSVITPRIQRHFNIISYTELDEEIILYIFNTLISHFLGKFEEPVQTILPVMVDTVLVIFNTVKLELLPTPKKSHYTFNLRDISKVFQGICTASIKYCNEKAIVTRLWYHENLRIFHDRLIDDDDREYFKEILAKQFEKFNIEKDEVLNVERILFGDFLQGREVDPRHYQQCADLKELISKMQEFQEEYNQDPSFSGIGGKNAMKLVLFLDACEHICRIQRVLRQPLGHSLLLGVGGSGRQSLSKMSTFIAGYHLFQIEVIKGYNMRSWREDIKVCLMMAGVEKKEVTFLFVDTQIINEQQVEDLNNILNSGDVTGIYQDKDMEEIVTACKQDCMKKNLQPNKMNIFAQYLGRVKQNVHLVIAMSPLSSVFQTRLRMFPSLVNCCTLDWFTEWPEEALLGVGKGQLAEFAEDMNIENDLLEKLVDCFKTMHKSVEKISIQYKNQLRRTNYVTPTSYLELLIMFKSVLKEKRNELKTSVNRLKTGLDRLIEANIEVENMQITLKDLQPKLEVAAQKTEEVMKQIAIDKKSADETQQLVSQEETLANKEAAIANGIKKQAEEQVADANKILDAAVAEVKKLNKSHIVEVKSLKTPPPASLDILGAMCYLLQDVLRQKGQIGMKMKAVEGSMGKKTEDYQQTASILLNEPQVLLDLLVNYDKENINQTFIQQLEVKILPSPNFNLEKASSCSIAIKYIYLWARAMYDFNRVFLETQPLRNKLETAERTVQEKMQIVAEKRAMLDEVTKKLEKLEADYNENIAKKQELELKMENCKITLDRAIKLTSGLSGEKIRWTEDIAVLSSKEDLLAGNSVIGAGMVAYSGPFTSNYRQALEQSWIEKLDQLTIPHAEGITMSQFLGVPVTIQQWNICGLPKDETSIENGIIIDKSRRWTLMIDPQTQANKFIKNLGKDFHEEGIEIIKMSDNNLMRVLEIAIQNGKFVLVENVGKELDPSLDPILLQQVVKSSGGGKSIQIGDKTLNYNDSFRFFMTTTNPNPSYSPETFVKVCIINFGITKQGLEDQMLALIVALENPQLQQKKTDIVKRNAQDKKDLFDIEDKILKSLSQSDQIDDLLKDETLINTLQNAKRFAAEINQRMQDSKITEVEIDKAREGYRPVAYRASILFFCILDLNGIDPMYEYSLQWFMNLFKMGVEAAPPSKEHQERLENLNNYFTYSLYENICRSLFERHKLLFSFILTMSILQGDGNMNEEEWRYLLTGPTGDIHVPDNPTNWVADNQWSNMYKQIYGMSQLECLNGFEEDFMKNPDRWKQMYDSLTPHLDPLAEPWHEKLVEFQKIIVIKSIRPDKVVPAVFNFISNTMGEKYIIPPTFDLACCYRDATILTPLIFVLSTGSDPKSDFVKFADSIDMGNRINSISLGQGQGIKAERLIREYMQKGGWVLLQNCHLAVSWMPDLEKVVEEFDPDHMHPDFRLWLSSMPSNQNGVKMTLEPPMGLRSNLKRSYISLLPDEVLNDCRKPDEFKKLAYGFCFFHAIIQDRRKFGPIGWNIPYEFTMEDLQVTIMQLKMLLDEYDVIPWKVLNFLGAKINYGGRVTDAQDVNLIGNIIETFMNEGILTEGHSFSPSGTYISPPIGDQSVYLTFIDTLPLDPQPEIFGMHDNAEITNAQNQTIILLETIQSIQPRNSSGAGKTREEVIEELANFVQSRTPKVFDYNEIFKKYPTDYNESMNTVLCQEVIRYNRLLSAMHTALQNVKKALKGLVVMSEELDSLANSLFDNQVPSLWADVGFLSLKPLASWTQDLNDRIDFLNNWINGGTPMVFWISGFFFPQAFITGTLQNFARKYKIAVDQLSFDFVFLDDLHYTDVKEKAPDGCYIYGMYLEGCKWDSSTHQLNDSNAKELFSNLPMLQLVPVQNRTVPVTGIYMCPLYKVVSRRGTLSTTGHSTNYVMEIELPSDRKQQIWNIAGVAAFLSLRY